MKVTQDLSVLLRSSTRANITLSGKKRRKLLQQIRLAQKEKATMEGEVGADTKGRELHSDFVSCFLVPLFQWMPPPSQPGPVSHSPDDQRRRKRPRM